MPEGQPEEPREEREKEGSIRTLRRRTGAETQLALQKLSDRKDSRRTLPSLRDVAVYLRIYSDRQNKVADSTG